MAVTTGDTFVIPVRIEDLASAPLQKIVEAGSNITAGFTKVRMSIISLNQSIELVSKAFRLLGTVFESTTTKAIALEKSVAEISTLIDQTTGVTKYFTEEILAMQTTFGTGQQDIAKAYYEALSSGAVTAANATEFLTAAQKLATGGVTTLNVAVDGLTNIINAYGMGVSETSKISDAFFIGAKAGKTRIEELSRELGQVAPLAYATGVSMQELVGSVSAITIGGVRTNEAVTQVQSALVGLSRQTPQLTAVLDKLGISNVKVAVQSRGLVNVLKQIIAETDGSTESLVELFGRVEAVQGILSLTGKTVGSKFVDIMSEMKAAASDTGKVTEEAFQKLTKTTDFQMNVLKGSIEASLTRIGGALKDNVLPPLKLMSEALKAVVDTASAFGKAFAAINTDALKRQIDLTIVILNTLAAAMAVVFRAQVAQAIQTATSLMLAYSKAVWAAATPWVLLATKVLAVTAVVIGAVAAIEIVIRNINQFGTLIEAVGGVFISWGLRIQRFFEGVLLAIMNTTMGIARSMNKIGLVSNEVITSWGADVLAQSDKIDQLNASIEETDTQIAEVSKTLDMGLTGEVVSQATKAFQVFSKEIEGSTERVKILGSEVAKVVGADKELAIRFELKGDDKKALEEFVKKTKDLSAALKESDLSQRDIIEARRVAQLDEIKTLEDKLLAQKNLSKEGKVQLDKVKAFKDAVNKTANLQLQQKGLSGMFGGGVIESAGNQLGKVAGNMIATLNPVTALMSAAEAIVGIVQKLIDFIPNILNAVANIINSLTDLPLKILESVKNIFNSITKEIANSLPNVLTMLFGLVESAIDFLAQGIPDAVSKLVTAVPEIIQKFIDKLPELAGKLGQALIKSNFWVIGIKIMIGIVKALPTLIVSLVKQMPAIVEEFVKGFALAGKEFVNMISNFLGMGDLFNIDTSAAMDKLNDLGDKIATSASQLFQVVDLEATARGLDVADRIRSAINSSTTRAQDVLTRLWNQLKSIWDNTVRPILDAAIRGLSAAWSIIEASWRALVNLLSTVWNQAIAFLSQTWTTLISFSTRVWSALTESLSQVWSTATSALSSVFSVFQGAWSGLMDLFSTKITIFEGAGKALGKIFEDGSAAFSRVGQFFSDTFNTGSQALQRVFIAGQEVGTKIWEGVKKGFSEGGSIFSQAGQWIMDTFRRGLDGLGDLFASFGTRIMDGAKAAMSKLQEAFDQLNPGNLLSKIFKVDMGGRGTVENALGIDIPFMAFAEGGLVPGQAAVGGDSALNDRILALLSPGEAIVPRSVMSDPFLSKLIEAVISGNLKPPAFAWGGTLGKVLSGDVQGAVSDVQNMSIESALEQFDPRKLWDLVSDKVLKELVWKMFEANKFAQGGPVDNVPAMLSPGEFVVNRDSARANLSLLSRINQTSVPVDNLGEINQTVNVTINAKTDLSADQIRREVVPVLEKELRKKSQQGRYVIASAGVRA